MIKKLLLILTVLFGLVQPIQADIYHIPEELMQEVRDRKAYLEKHPDSQEALFELAMSYAYTGQIRLGWGTLKQVKESYAKDVVELYKPLVEQDKTDWKSAFKLAFGYFFTKQKEKALEAFYIARDRNPENVWILGFIALVKGEMGEVDEAMKICKKALKMEPNATGIHFLLAEGYRKKGKYMKFMSHMMIVGRLETEEALMREQ
jgi:tetratricopeptide (TPR) repeat protein